MRYPTEVNIVADAGAALGAIIPLLRHNEATEWREEVTDNVARWWETVERQAMLSADPVNPMRWFGNCRNVCPMMRSCAPTPGPRRIGMPGV